MENFIECEDCGFTLLSESDSTAVPKRVESCPGCGGTEFGFPE